MSDASGQIDEDLARRRWSGRLRWSGAIFVGLSLVVWGLETGFTDGTATTSKFWQKIRAVGWDLPEFVWIWELLSQAVARDALIGMMLLMTLLLRSRRDVQLLILVPITSGIVVNLMKVIVGRPRPHGDIGSWPSGHASSAFALLVVAFLVRFRCWRTFAVLVALAAWSRVMLERHWPSDLIASLGVACLCASMVVRLPVLIPRWIRSPRFVTFVAGAGWLHSAVLFPFAPERSHPNLSWALFFWTATFLVGLQRIADHELEQRRST